MAPEQIHWNSSSQTIIVYQSNSFSEKSTFSSPPFFLSNKDIFSPSRKKIHPFEKSNWSLVEDSKLFFWSGICRASSRSLTGSSAQSSWFSAQVDRSKLQGSFRGPDGGKNVFIWGPNIFVGTLWEAPGGRVELNLWYVSFLFFHHSDFAKKKLGNDHETSVTTPNFLSIMKEVDLNNIRVLKKLPHLPSKLHPFGLAFLGAHYWNN